VNLEWVSCTSTSRFARTLFQAITRTNRTWTNPDTAQEKVAGLVIDYIGLGAEIAKAVQLKRRE
jgi:type I site-specific restriction-modification system R (restriction) subunit